MLFAKKYGKIKFAIKKQGVILMTDNKNIGEIIGFSPEVYKISPDLYKNYDVKRGLRNLDGSGVLAGLTGISEVHGYVVYEGEKTAD